MNIVLSTGILLFTGYIMGMLAEKINLPRISGYILAGILLNPDFLGIMPKPFVQETDPLLSMSLSLITFSIGGSLLYKKVKASGRVMILLMLFESLSAFLFVFIFVFGILYFFIPLFNSTVSILIVSMLLAALAAPTDPSATIAVIQEYKAKGVVSSAMLEIAAFDDVAGIVIYTLVTAAATWMGGDSSVSVSEVGLELGKDIGGAIVLGIALGFIYDYIVKWFKNQSEGALLVITIGMVLLTYGIADFLEFEALLATMALGATVINSNPLHDKIFNLIEQYTDELIFVIFFSLSGLHLQLSALSGSVMIVAIYIVARMIGKFTGIYTGSRLLNADPKIKKYAAGGLLPQGGIVIGLAILLSHQPAFENLASVIIGIVIGAALIHEIIGPIFSKISLKKAGEI